MWRRWSFCRGARVEAVALLRKALLLDALNPFTWNNLGVAEEAIGDYDNALKAYNAAAETHSSEPVVLALDRSWRGRPVSTMAAASARRLAEWMKKKDSAELDAIMLTSRGVSATNQNDWLAAREDFLRLTHSILPVHFRSTTAICCRDGRRSGNGAILLRQSP